MANPAVLIICFIFMAAISDTVAEHSSITSSPAPQPTQQEQPQGLHQSFSPTSIFEPILNHLGFHELAMAVPSLHDSPSFSTWKGPSTVFAPTDASINSCTSCSLRRLLSEHIVPGLYSFSYLQTLRFGTKVETMSSGHCLTITSSANRAANRTRIFIDGVEITSPDLFNNGLVVVHGLDGFVSSLSPISCSVEKAAPPQIPTQPPEAQTPPLPEVQTPPPPPEAQTLPPPEVQTPPPPGVETPPPPEVQTPPPPEVQMQTQTLPEVQTPPPPEVETPPLPPPPPSPVMDLMLRDAMLRLRTRGYGIMALAMRIKYPDLVNLGNATLFALDDSSIFSGYQSYISNVRFHIVPNHLLTMEDLSELPMGTVLPTLNRRQFLVVTTTSSIRSTATSINYVEIRSPEIVKNPRIVVHSLFMPFPHLHISTARQINDSSTEEP